MILVDTSVWIDHFRRTSERLYSLLMSGLVLTQPLIIGEIAMGSLSKRSAKLALLDQLPRATEADHEEVRHFIERYELHGKGIGFVDAHLLVSAKLSAALLWTNDKRLREVAKTLSLAA